MQRVLGLMALAVLARAGTVEGVVLEHASGRALARTVVRLEPVPQPEGTKGPPLATRAGLRGHFVFPNVASGTYIVAAVRAGYFNAAFGQRLPTGHGIPIEVTADSHVF